MFIIEKIDSNLLVHNFAYEKAKSDFKTNCQNEIVEIEIVPKDIEKYDVQNSALILVEIGGGLLNG